MTRSENRAAGEPLHLVMLGATGAVGQQALATLIRWHDTVQVTTLGGRAVELPADSDVS